MKVTKIAIGMMRLYALFDKRSHYVGRDKRRGRRNWVVFDVFKELSFDWDKETRTDIVGQDNKDPVK